MDQVFSNELRLNLLVTALEGGSNYWYWIKTEEYPELEKKLEGELPFCEALLDYILEENSIEIYDIEDIDYRLGYISLDNMSFAERELEFNYPDIYESIIEETYDANDADAWFQLVVMKEIIFG